jgi:hypothetical protein
VAVAASEVRAGERDCDRRRGDLQVGVGRQERRDDARQHGERQDPRREAEARPREGAPGVARARRGPSIATRGTAVARGCLRLANVNCFPR